MEARIQEAIAYIETHPESKVTTVAKEFGITRAKLRGRLDGRQPKKGQPAQNTRLTNTEEKALLRYIDRLDYTNLTPRPELINKTIHHLL